jgi:hypothetical protein
MVNAQLGRRAARTQNRADRAICLGMICAQTRCAFVARDDAPITHILCRLIVASRCYCDSK